MKKREKNENVSIGDVMGTRSAYHRMLYQFILLGIITILLTPSLHAESYYADVTITVDTAGFVTIEGLTNYPDLIIKNTEMYTSKQQSLWLINITKEDMFSEFIYELTLPKDSSINYIKTTGFIRIEENLGNLVVRGFGENETLSILIQYKTEKKQDILIQETIIYLILLSAIIIVSILLLFLYQKEKKTKETPVIENKKEPTGDWKGLNHRQKQIIQILQKKNVPLTQTDIQKELQIPKASVSRNIRGLERKGLIEKEQIGMSNLIRLKKP
ncbi:MAG: MarR family transcriptional regulator [Methanobacteriota archaeon]